MERYVVNQESIDKTGGRAVKTKIPMWAQGSRPKRDELAYLSDAARRRHQDPQPGSQAEFGRTITVSRERALKVGSLPVVYSRRTVEEIDVLTGESLKKRR